MRLPLRKWLVAYVRRPLSRTWDSFVDWYWQQPPRRRRRAGRSLLLALALTAGLALYGVWHGVTGIAHWWNDEPDEETTAAGGEETFPAVRPRLTYHYVKHGKRNINYARTFNDINDTQLAAARRFGIRPVEDRAAAERMGARLVQICDCRYYKVDPLTHSIPYLVPDAADFLLELGKLFQEYSGTESRFIITSVLRTKTDVRRLRRSGNANATENSCHFYATTIDITYNRFDRHGRTWDGRLKENLAQALYDLRAAGYCYVKYEYRQACFHITVRR